MKLHDDLREFIALMNSHGVEYLIVGGYAVAYHGYPRYTGDLDVWVRVSPENARKVLSVLAAFGFGGVGLTEADFLIRDRVVQLGNPPNRIDLLTGITAGDFDAAWSSRVQDRLDGEPVFFIPREALLANKGATGRPRDAADVAELTRRTP